jgi:hypothetical protein
MQIYIIYCTAGSNLFRNNVPQQQSTAAMYECTSILMHVNDTPACMPASYYWLYYFPPRTREETRLEKFGQQAILTTVPGQNPVVVGDFVIYVVGRPNNIAIVLCAISINVERRSK